MSLKSNSLSTLSNAELTLKVKSSLEDKKSLEFLLKNLDGISWQFDLNANKFTYVSPSAKELLGYEIEEWTDIASWIMMLHEDDRDRVSSYCATETQDAKDHTMEYRMLKKNGETIWIFDIVRLIKDENSKPEILYGFLLDITKRKNEQLKIEKEHAFLQTIINGISDPVIVINKDYSVEIMNNAIQKKLIGRTFIDKSSPKCYEVLHHQNIPCKSSQRPCPLESVMTSKKKIKAIHKNTNSDGSERFLELVASPLFNEDNDCIGIIKSARDITSHIKLTQELEEKSILLEYQATHDYLTGLPNRALFMDRLEQSIKDADRHKNSIALFFMDLDYFKQINDTLGHAMGDEVLKAVCQKFRACTRASDILSRLGGDEFTVILKDIKEERDIITIAQKFIDALNTPLIINEHSLKLSVSIGISIYTSNSGSSQKLLQRADKAMYEAKVQGKSNFKFSPLNPSTF